MVGPALGGWLYSIGGFTAPFLVLGTLLLPTAAVIYFHVPSEMFRVNKEADGKAEVSLRALMRNPQVMIIAIASMLANSDYAFLEPTLGDHATANKVATTPDSIGMLFSIASITYTVSCPLTGILANRSRLGPRRVIVTGLVLQLVGFLLIGPSPILRTGEGRGDAADGRGPRALRAGRVHVDDAGHGRHDELVRRVRRLVRQRAQ